MVGDITIRRTGARVGYRWCWEVQMNTAGAEYGPAFVGGWTCTRRGALREARRNGGERLT